MLLWSGTAQAEVRPLNIPSAEPVHGFGLRDILPGIRFHQPIAIVNQPGADTALFVAERSGRIYVVPNLDNPTKSLFLDLTANNAWSSALEAGLLGLVFHPDFEANRTFFVYRCLLLAQPGGGVAFFNRLSRFKTLPGQPFVGDPASEEILIEQKDYAIQNHNSGDLHFGPEDGYLYVSLGDQSPPPGEHELTHQPIDKSFFGAIIRIDVDGKPGSLRPNPHPSVRGGYRVPPDNPFIGFTNYQGIAVDPGQVRTEIYALGFRNPWRFSFDPLTGRLFCGDVGESHWEEVNLVENGGNYGWPYREAGIDGPHLSTAPHGFESTPPIHAYPHGKGTNNGNAVIGGRVYIGQALPRLYGDYIFGDNVRGNVWALRRAEDSDSYTAHWIAGEPNISAFGQDPRDSELLVANLLTGQLKKLVYENPEVSPLPVLLSETGWFQDLENLTPGIGVTPYSINTPFWSDSGGKQRWFHLPGNGPRMGFVASNHWSFPEGTIWVKHFELELKEGDPASSKRLETRFVVKTEDSAYGVVYKWNEDGTDAELLPPEGLDEQIQITNLNGTVRTQVWHYPSRVECMTCHNEKAGFALGFNTHQLNRLRPGTEENQLDLLALEGYLTNYFGQAEQLPRLAKITDRDFSTEFRVRSYFEANCAQCHRSDVPFTAFWDARFHVPMDRKNVVDGSRIKPNSPQGSHLYSRLAFNSVFRVPPIATSEIDLDALELLRDWINGMPQAPWLSSDFGTPIAKGHASVLGAAIEVAGYASPAGSSPSGRSLMRPVRGAARLLAKVSRSTIQDSNGRAGLLFATNSTPHPGSWFAGVNGQRLFVTDSIGQADDLGPLPKTDLWLRMVSESAGLGLWTETSGGWARIADAPPFLSGKWFAGFAAGALTGNQENYALFEEVSFLQISLRIAGNLTNINYLQTLEIYCDLVGDTNSVHSIDLLVNGEVVGEAVPPLFNWELPVLPPGQHELVARANLQEGLPLHSFPLRLQVGYPIAGAWLLPGDVDTGGDWQKDYGGIGYTAPDFQALPSLAEITNFQASAARASGTVLSSAALSIPETGDRSGAWWEGPEISFDLEFKDELLHRVAFYFADLENAGFTEQITVTDKFGGAVVYQGMVTGFSGGQYIVLNLRGSLRVTITGEPRALLSGIFFDESPVPLPTIEFEDIGSEVLLPSTVTLQPNLNPADTVREVSFSINGIFVQTVTNPPFHLELENLLAGRYEISAVVTDIYSQPSSPATGQLELLLPAPKARWLGTDVGTQGDWKGTYGNDGFLVVASQTNLPAYVSLRPTGHQVYQYYIAPEDRLGLQGSQPPHRVRANWAAFYQFDSGLSFLDGHTRIVSLYGGWQQTRVQISNPATGELLDERVMGDSHPGIYYRWAIKGDVRFRFIRESGAASVNAFFFDPATPYNDWLLRHFNEAEIQEETLFGPAADPDGDGQSNMLEYALATNPRTPTEVWSNRYNSGDSLVFSVQLNHTASEAQAFVEASPDLHNWSDPQTHGLEVHQVVTNSVNTLMYSVTPADGTPALFLRLRLVADGMGD